ncbi:hypothetical protein RF11_07936 [Thelohanellus kitauei]|uniref:Uncharacterized protein n=1 Tax=Thelohanellus kitauei TaxID=669202 RepID=A0A0C2M4V9_THEKT|nr:hypothetical protein RF11_07936 [Thelohanellus kitauei]
MISQNLKQKSRNCPCRTTNSSFCAPNHFHRYCMNYHQVRTQESREHDKPVPDDYEVPESDDEEMHKSSTDHDNIEEPINDHPEDGDDLDEPVDQESEELDYEYGEDGQKIYKNNESVHKRTLAEIRQSAHKYDDMHRDFMSKLENPTNAKIQELETLIADNNAKVKSIQSELSQLIRNLQYC